MGSTVCRFTYLGRHGPPGDGYPHNLNEISNKFYIHTDAECQHAPDEGLASGNAKGNKDIQKGMQETAATEKQSEMSKKQRQIN